MMQYCCEYEKLEEEDFIDPKTKKEVLREELVGEKIQVDFGKQCGGWFDGDIKAFDAESGEHEIYFENDKTTEYLNLKEQRKHKWQIFPYKETWRNGEQLVV